MSGGILDVDDVEGSGMLFTVHDDADATQVTTSRDHANVARLELDVIGDLARGDVHLHAVLGLDQRVGVPRKRSNMEMSKITEINGKQNK